MILYIENPKDSTKKLFKTVFELVNEFGKQKDTKLVYKNLLYFYILIMNYQKDKLVK